MSFSLQIRTNSFRFYKANYDIIVKVNCFFTFTCIWLAPPNSCGLEWVLPTAHFDYWLFHYFIYALPIWLE